MHMLFEWDENKAKSNKLKHKVSFNLATYVFDDPAQLSVFDKTVNGEDRYITLGLVNHTILFVCYCYRENENGKTIIRIISARKATTKEKACYDTGASERIGCY
jgi:uncharacterized DUF497 family protein